ncbi:hypothetical protein [Gracilimonas sp.]|uniref:hypothetical protein n=1 Tax=Gracilimonas sp. TaxID=1974203 RepID=UPI0032EBBFAC
MKLLKKNIVFLLMLSGFFSLNTTDELLAQTDEASKAQYAIWRGNTSVMQTKNDEVRGSQFYNDEWKSGKVIFRDKTVSDELPLKYNSYENLLIFKDGELMRVFEPTDIQGFIFLNEKGEVTERFMNGIYEKEYDIQPTQLLRVIYNGDTKLLAKHKIFFSKNAGRDPFSNVSYSEFKEKTDYFILQQNGDVKETRIRQKNLIRDLANHKKELKEFVKSSDMKVKSEKEAIALLNFYDQLGSAQ